MAETQWAVLYTAIDGFTTDRSKAMHGTNLICFGRVPKGYECLQAHPVTIIPPDSKIAQFLDEHSALIAKESRERELPRQKASRLMHIENDGGD